jgi:protoporphyrin/coproporphyrin ferrochelatase
MMNSDKTAVLLVNVGTPDSPSVGHVRSYLFQFLNDRRVIDLPLIPQKLLVNGIIVPFRAPKSSKLYRALWTPEGSPLLVISRSLQRKLQTSLGESHVVFLAMRYAKPNLKEVLETIREKGFKKLVVAPLFPHYASSTTGTVVQRVMEIVKNWYVIPEIRFIGQFYDHPKFLEAFCSRAREYNFSEYDHILFSYHGLPNSQVNKTHPGTDAKSCTCTTEFPEHGRFCYKATCYETTRLLAAKLGLDTKIYSTAFQSRLTNNWLEPFSDEVIIGKAKDGAKKILVLAPAFVTDCLETTHEIGVEYQELFEEHGGEKVDLVESLNDQPLWVELLSELVMG